MDLKEMGGAFFNLCKLYRMYNKRKAQRRWQVRPLNSDWITSEHQRKVFLKMKEMDAEQFFVQTRMSPKLFEMLLGLVTDELWKPKQRIEPEERLSITLHYLAHGVCIQSLAWMYKIGRTTVRCIILETCEVLWHLLSPVYVSEPSEQQYKDIAYEFNNLWNMPNCVSAIDGKHIAIKCPPKSGSLYYNYKKFSSIVFMAACDAKYTFTSVSVGSYGSQSDGGILRSFPFGEALICDKLRLPQAAPLPENCESIVLVCVALHNFIMLNDNERWYCPERYVDGEGPDHTLQGGTWRVEDKNSRLRPIVSFVRRASGKAFELREFLANYFMNEGAVSFQDAMI